MSVVSSDTSVTHTFGNVACVAMDYIESYFPDDFFQTVHISTKMAHRQLDVFRSKREFWKNQKPMLIIRPREELDDSSTFMYGSGMKTRLTNSKLAVEFSNTVPVIKDEQNGVMLRLGWNRLKIYYDVAIIVETYNQQIDIAHALKNQMVPLTPFYINTYLESYLPKGIVYPIAKQLGVEQSNTAEILKYLNSQGSVPFTYKLKNGSGNDEYFMMYPTNIEAILSDISIDDGEGRNMIMDTYTINLSMSLEFNAVGTWYAFLKDAQKNYYVHPLTTELVQNCGNCDRIKPLLTLPLRYDLHLQDGWKILQSPTYVVATHGIGERFKDVTEFGSVIPSLVKNTLTGIIEHSAHYGIPISPYIKFRCFKDTKELPLGKNGFEINLKTFEVYTYNCTPGVTYRLFILINNLKINSIATEVTKFNEK